jgi:hypothetical protein
MNNTLIEMPELEKAAMSSTGETATEIRPFRVDIPEEKLTDLRQRIAAMPWPEKWPQPAPGPRPCRHAIAEAPSGRQAVREPAHRPLQNATTNITAHP